MMREETTTEQPQLIYREIARALRELAPTLRHAQLNEELELLALRYLRLAEFREELSLLHSLPRHRPLVVTVQGPACSFLRL